MVAEKKKERDIYKLAEEIKNLIPESECLEFRNDIKKLRHNIQYMAPELRHNAWSRLHDILMDHIGKLPIHDWQYEAWAKFTGKTKEEIIELSKK